MIKQLSARHCGSLRCARRTGARQYAPASMRGQEHRTDQAHLLWKELGLVRGGGPLEVVRPGSGALLRWPRRSGGRRRPGWYHPLPLIKPEADRWVCLEPAPLAGGCPAPFDRGRRLPRHCGVRVGTQVDLDASETFDTLLYIHVLEHIEHDRARWFAAARGRAPGGHLVVLCPAHQWLFTPFMTERLGHFRRYTKQMFRKICAPVRIRSAWPTRQCDRPARLAGQQTGSPPVMPTLGRSPCGTKYDGPPVAHSSTPFSVTPWVNRCWGLAKPF